MYSTREKLIHFNQLVNPQAVEADLALLHEKNPQSTDFVRFDHAPEKNSEDILFALLDVCEHDEIVRNRREFFAAENENTDKNSGDGGNGTPSEDTGAENPTDGDGEGNGTPSEDTGTENPTDGEGNDTPSEGTDTENLTDGEGNGTPSKETGTENPTDGEGNDTSSEGTDTENPTDGEGNDIPSEDTGAETDNVDNSVDNSSEEGKGNQPKKPATPKKKKKSTRK